jgi:DNA-binding MarR family transcriptional regulator
MLVVKVVSNMIIFEKQEKNLPNYYSVLPANVRYCPDLSDFEKILYSEISALTNALGYCFASNNYFAELYKKDVSTISRAIKKLEEYDFIKTEVKKKEGNKRYIYLNTPIGKNAYTPIGKNAYTPIGKNAYSNINNTSINTDINHIGEKVGRNGETLPELFEKVYFKARYKKVNE